MENTLMPDGGLFVHEEFVQPNWVDYNGHMNVAYYVLVFDHGTDALLDILDMGVDYRLRTDSSEFIVESHITYVQEVVEKDPLQVASLLLDFDDKRLHLFHHMYHGDSGKLCATNELMLIHVDMKSRRSAPFPPLVMGSLETFSGSQRPFKRPAQTGSVIGIKRH